MTNEPTTGEIVSALRNCPNCGDCLRKDQKCYGNDEEAADRLESQERAIAELTARAESAEAREAAAIADMQDNCQYCVGYEREADEPPCSTCYNARTFEPNDVERTKNWKWRGLQPQDGGGK